MEESQLLYNSTIVNIELYVCFLFLLVFLFENMRRSFLRNSREKEKTLDYVYICVALMLISDCTWTILSMNCKTSDIVAYAVNLIYFISSSTAAVCWFFFTMNHLKMNFWKQHDMHTLLLLPYLAVITVYVASIHHGLIFSIRDGEYIRGDVFFLDPAIKGGYIVLATLLAFVSGLRKKKGYLRKQDFNFALFGVPVMICAIFQIITGVGFNSLGTIIGMFLIYMTGITNSDSENTDAIYSLGNSFEASYIVNMDTGVIRPLCLDQMHDKEIPAMRSMDFTTHFVGVLSGILVSEDREDTLKMFRMENVAKRFEIDNAFSIRYRVREKSGRTSIHMAFFIRATANSGKSEFLLGINTLNTDSLLYERNEKLNIENQRLEQVNASIIESIAKIVETRDGGSGEHIVRVKKLTEILAREIMRDCPEYHLNEEKVKMMSAASVLHDVGKIAIPDAILLKPGRLTEDEFRIMKTHSEKGCEMLNMFPLGLDDAFLECALSICRWHHEKYDGLGYPDGLVGEDIPIAAQIVSVADCFDALVSERPYKKAFPPEKAIEMIMNGECGSLSPKVIFALDKQKNRLMEMARLHKG